MRFPCPGSEEEERASLGSECTVAVFSGTEGERHFHTPGGESYESIRDRIADFLASVALERVVVVSHGGAGRIFRGVYGGLAKAQMVRLEIPQDAVYRLQNGQIDRFDCEPVE